MYAVIKKKKKNNNHVLFNFLYRLFSFILIGEVTTKKGGYPSVLKIAGIALKSAGIGSKFLSQRFLSRRLKPPRFECRNRVAGPVPALFKSARIGPRAF